MKHARITIIVLAFVVLGSLYSFVIPLGEGPDEPGHAGYVFFLARERRLPDQRADEVPGEGHQPPLAYALAAPLAAWLPAEDRTLDWPANPRFTWADPAAGLGQARELNALAHGSREFWPWRGPVLAWHMARLASVALGVATVVLTYLAARELNCRLVAGCRVDREQSQATSAKRLCAVPLLAAALVAFNPQFLFLSALVTNDALLAALSALVLWLAVGHAADHQLPTTIYRRMAADPNGYALLIGLVLGLALLTKQSALLLAPVALVSAIERSWRAERRLWSARHLGVLGLFTGSALLVCGWWYWRNLRLYGDLFGLSVFRAEFATQAFDARSPAAWAGALAQLHESFWARFGWMNLPAPAWVLGLFTAIELAALVGWACWGLRNQGRRQAERETSRAENRLVSRISPWLYLLLLPALALAWVVSFALTAGLVAWQGRLLFPALPAAAILLALGLRLAGSSKQVAASGKQSRTAIYWLLLVAACLLAFWLPFGVIGAAYPAQTLPEAAALARLGQPTYARLGRPGDPGAELLGWQVDQPARAGAAAELTLMWYARGRQARDWTVFVHLVDANDQIVAEDNQRPRGGAFPTTQWVAGDWVEDRHTLNIPAELPPGAYRLRIGLFDERTQERAGVFSRGGRLLGDHHLVGNIQIE